MLKYKEHGVGLATGRAGNVIGGGDWADDRLIPDIIKAFIKKKPVIIRNPRAIRPWQHVLEPLRGYLMLAEKLYKNGSFFSESFNFGPIHKDARSVEWILKKLSNLCSNNLSWSLNKKNNTHEACYLKLDINKVKIRLGWKPFFSLSEALDKTLTWYQSYYNKLDIKQITIGQIKQYCNNF
jgi:CDP-glucose 4,6-dehydratase